jgi:uncharacterized protein DUF5916
MFLPLLLLHLGGTDPALVYNGRSGSLDVRPPRLDLTVKVDGTLDEAAWSQAALLTGFSQFSPLDGIPASDSTEVLVWYSADAIHFGIRAFEPHGRVHATLADRDKISTDDYVQLYLSTFDDARQATVLAVNPFGVQADGALVETGSTSGSGFNNAIVRREAADLSPDIVFESKGRLTEYGYEVEVRVPFKSLRFQPSKEQRWGINVTRLVQHSGQEDSWVPARRASASFLAQSGHLVGLADLQRGLVLDLNPSLTSKTTGAAEPGGWNYSGGGPELGGSVRWGITNNLNLNGTANPDFSQVESDAGQFQFDPRDELFFSEKRPFFLDGSEQFNTPNQLIYTRRVVQPVAAVKLTGKGFGTDIGLLSAVDDKAVSATGDHPVYNLLRLQRDIGSNSRFGLVYTDRIEGGNSNRVGGVDGRFVRGAYSAQFQVAGSRTTTGGGATTAPLFFGRLIANGHTLGFRATFIGSDPDFRARSGFFSRPGFSRLNFQPRVSFFGKSGSLMENLTIDLNLDGQYRYGQFATSAGMQEEKVHLNANLILYGGWHVGASVLTEQFGYPSEVYTDYRLELPRAGGGADTVAFVGRPAIPNKDYVLSLDTPEFAQFSGSLFLLWGNDENFYEWASGQILWIETGLDWRPTDKLRLNATYKLNQVNRRTDGSLVNVNYIPRLKVEYQASRPIFIRLVGEYTSERQSALRDDTRTDAPILVFDPEAGDFVRTTPLSRKSFRGDLLFSYQPTPGTVLFAGYGSTLRDPVDPDDPLRTGLRRFEDGFFFKMSYLFRM